MIGSNVPAHPGRRPDGLAELFQWANEWGCDCAQTYITLTRTWKVPQLTTEEVTCFKAAWQTSRVKQVVAHVPLFVNLASPAKEIWEKSKERLSQEMIRANALGVQALVLHPGSASGLGKKTGIERTSNALRTALESVTGSSAKLLLETTAGQGTALGSRFEEISQILGNVDRNDVLGVCLDTCHIFAAGYDFSGYNGYERVLREFDEVLGVGKIRAIHLNDSKTSLGSRVDRHAPIGLGMMGVQVFHALVSDSRFNEVPKILEIVATAPEFIPSQLKLLREYASSSSRLQEPRKQGSQTRVDDALFSSSG